jgi:hypothetical protein
MDVGEMFLNFPLHPKLQAFSGVDFMPYKEYLGYKNHVGQLNFCLSRSWMGSRISPHEAVQFYYLAEAFVRGNRKDEYNPFAWDLICLNLPGSPDYDPSLPRVMNWVTSKGWIACDLIVFIDDLHGTGPTVELAWRVAQTVSSRLQYLGVQDAARKHTPPTTTPGAWAGSVFRSTSKSVICTVTQ